MGRHRPALVRPPVIIKIVLKSNQRRGNGVIIQLNTLHLRYYLHRFYNLPNFMSLSLHGKF